ncbi:uncharacterized protein [Porites lutea]|uniref:uncharacterized protein isoform X4 n=1 Tax=Porites lutea TaxID=51062 RepID=UPI003CC5822D
MVSYVVSRVIMLVFGTLYPAYSSYKAMKTKNVREYVRWMMYWIVFALFITVELFADLLLGFWFPFYYELKIIFMLWLLLPATKGSSILYRKFVHPWLSKNEKGQTVLAEKLRHYGTDATDNKRGGRLHKAKSWYGGMNTTDNDYMPIDESEEYSLIEEREEEEEEESVNPDVESAKLNEELREHPKETKTQTTKRSRGSSNYQSLTLPRSYGRTSHRARVHGAGYDPFESSAHSYNPGDVRTYERAASSRVQPRRSPRNKQGRSLPVIPHGSNEANC